MRAVQFSCNVALSGNKFRNPRTAIPLRSWHSHTLGIAKPQTELDRL
jgi:hypothetical protein